MIDQVVYFMSVVWDFLCSLNDCPDGVSLAVIDPFTAVAAGIGAATSIGNAIFGSSSARKQQKEQQAAIEKQKAEERAWFNRKYNEDATQRADAQRILNRANDAIKKRTQAAMGRKAVVGGTDASVETLKQANAEQMGNAVSDIAAKADAKKDAIEQGYQSRMSALNSQEQQMNANYEAARRNAMAQGAAGVLNTAASVLANAGGDTAKGDAPKGEKPGDGGSNNPNLKQAYSVANTWVNAYGDKNKELAKAAEQNNDLPNIVDSMKAESDKKKKEADVYNGNLLNVLSNGRLL